MPLQRQRTYVGKKRRKSSRRKRVPRRKYQNKFTRPVHAVVKSKTLTGYDNVSLFGSDGMLQPATDPIEWHLIKPLNLNRVANTEPDDNDRQANTIFARNASCHMEVFPSKRYLGNFQIRICYGYFRGDNSVGSQTLTSTNMKTIYPEINTKLWDRDHAGKQDFKWKYQKTYTLCPRQVYDEDTEEGDHTGADRVLVANWMPRKFRMNFKFNRRHTFANSDGDSLDGWMPIIAIQCKQIPGGLQFTRPSLPTSADTGSNPGPRFEIATTTYWSDVH